MTDQAPAGAATYPVPQQAVRLGEEVTSIIGAIDPKAEIVTEEAAAAATEALSAIAAIRRNSEGARVALVKPLNDHVRFINGTFRQKLQPLAEVDEQLRVKLKAYAVRRQQEAEAEARRQHEEELRRQAEERERAEAAAREARTLAMLEGQEPAPEPEPEPEVMPAPPPPVAPPTRVHTVLGSASTQKVWKWELVSLEELCKAVAEGRAPAELVSVNSQVLNMAVKRRHEPLRDCPGIRIFQDDSLVVR